MSSYARLIAHYAASHRDPRNELLHCICVPAIVFAVLGLVYAAGLTPAVIAGLVALAYYARFGPRPALEMAAVLAAMLLIWVFVMPARHVVPVAAAIFVLAWIGQFIGHAYEGAKPSFLEDITYLMIGPLYVLHVLHRVGSRINPQSGSTPGG